MKTTIVVFVVLVLVCAVTSSVSQHFISKEMIDNVNRNNVGWRAVDKVEDSPLAHLSLEEAKRKLFISSELLPANLIERFVTTSKRAKYSRAAEVQSLSPSSLPVNFTSSEKWPGCVHNVRDQGGCGSCYSFAASEVLSDRFCVASNGSVNLVLSAQDLVSCSRLTFGCDGGMPQAVFWELQHNGIVPDECMVYTSGTSGHAGTCPSQVQCFGKTHKIEEMRYKVKSYHHVGEYFEKASDRAVEIQKELFENGPVDALFSVFSDFAHYKSGVYRWVSGTFEGLHAVKVIGYGVESNEPYWLVQNSWGKSWGDNGHFKILRSTDNCGFELMVYAGLPDIQNAPVHYRN